MRAISKQQAVIASGSSLSASVDLRFTDAVGINMPAAWDAADITFQVSDDAVTYRDLYDANGEYGMPADAGQRIIISPLDMLGVRFLKLRSGHSAAPVNQTADRTLEVITREIDC